MKRSVKCQFAGMVQLARIPMVRKGSEARAISSSISRGINTAKNKRIYQSPISGRSRVITRALIFTVTVVICISSRKDMALEHQTAT
jgi:hypothetical protein